MTTCKLWSESLLLLQWWYCIIVSILYLCLVCSNTILYVAVTILFFNFIFFRTSADAAASHCRCKQAQWVYTRVFCRRSLYLSTPPCEIEISKTSMNTQREIPETEAKCFPSPRKLFGFICLKNEKMQIEMESWMNKKVSKVVKLQQNFRNIDLLGWCAVRNRRLWFIQ